MVKEKRLFTSESVTEGHPDKIADQISDAILDAVLEQDRYARVAVETAVNTGLVLVFGEMTTEAYVDIQKVVRDKVKEIGYTRGKYGFDADNLAVMNTIDEQSPDIAQGVNNAYDNAEELGAGDQGLMFGYATKETPELMPLPIMLAHTLTQQLARVRKDGTLAYLRPDGKAQVTVEYDEDDKPLRIDTVVVSSQHAPDIELEQLRKDIKEHVILSSLPSELIDENTRYLINPTGRFVIGGPHGDAGLTGRKIIVDTYGGSARHGGGAFCVDGETEYLESPGVWRKINQYDGGKVAQFNDDFSIDFVEPLEYVNHEADKMYRIHTEQGLDMVLSENHDVVYLTEKNRRFKKTKVKDLIERYTNSAGVVSVRGSVPTYAKYFYDDNQTGHRLGNEHLTRLQVAFCADGTILTKGRNRYPARIRIIKKDKIERLRHIIEETGIDYRETTHADNYTYFYFKPPILDKMLHTSFENPSLEEAEIIAEESLYWDGSIDKKTYRTTIKQEADFMQFILTTVHSTSVSITYDDRLGTKYYREGKEYTRKSILYEVNILSRRGIGLRNGGRSTTKWDEFIPEDGRMYCFTVPSGKLILRRNDNIFVTGNSSKDATKVDRSASYMARYIAKNIVAADLADKCEVQLAYAIGVADPVSIRVDTFGTSNYSESDLTQAVRRVFKTTPGGIIEQLDLRRPIYAKTAAYGHFGRELPEFTWEQTDKVQALIEALNNITE